MKKINNEDEKSYSIEDILENSRKEKEVFKDFSRIICKVAEYTVKSLSVVLGLVLGLVIFAYAVLTGLSVGLALAPIYTTKCLITDYDEYRSSNEDVLKKCGEKLKDDLNNTLNFAKKTQEYIVSYNADKEARKRIKKINIMELDNIRQKGMDKTI